MIFVCDGFVFIIYLYKLLPRHFPRQSAFFGFFAGRMKTARLVLVRPYPWYDYSKEFVYEELQVDSILEKNVVVVPRKTKKIVILVYCL